MGGAVQGDEDWGLHLKGGARVPGKWMDGGRSLAFVPKGTRRPSGWEGGGDSHGRRGARPLGFVTGNMGREKGKRKQGRGLT
jgi:hypothetical protein